MASDRAAKSLGGDNRSAGYVDESRDLGHSLSTEAEPTAQDSSAACGTERP
jgi:hypothetical protein